MQKKYHAIIWRLTCPVVSSNSGATWWTSKQ